MKLRSSGALLAAAILRLIENLKRDSAARTYLLLSGLLLTATLSLCQLERHHFTGATTGRQLLISEFMASNASVLADQDGECSDWIEIHNRANAEIDLLGWYLTDDDNDLTKWRFPATTLPGNGYLVVFASRKDRAISGAELHTNFRLDSSGEYLALVESDGMTVAWEYAPGIEVGQVSFSRLGRLIRRRGVTPQYVPQFANVSYGLDEAGHKRYFLEPTPGRANSSAESGLGPVLSKVEHRPLHPAPGDDIVITAAAAGSLVPIGRIVLHYRIMYRDTIEVAMHDDGEHGDGQPGDGTYGAVIPGSVPTATANSDRVPQPGQMVRYYLTAMGTNGHDSRWPLYHDPIGSPQYYGTVVADPQVTSTLPILHWFVSNPGAARTRSGTRAELFYDGVFYDNVFVRRRGYSSDPGWEKKSFKFEFNRGNYFQFLPGKAPVEEFNLNNTYSDKAYIRQVLSWEAYRDAGVPYSISFPLRVQQNGQFHSVALFVEQPDERYLRRQGLDPDGALYKMNNHLEASKEGVAKRSRKSEDHWDLQALIDGIQLSGRARTNYLFDHVNIPAVINYMAVTTVIHDIDCAEKNYYLYCDTEGTGEWTFLPWDKDLTFGRVFLDHVLQDRIWADYDPASSPFGLGANRLIAAVYETPPIREMYLRRLRTLMDQLLQPPDTPAGELAFERRIDDLFQQMRSDVVLDAAAWPMEWGTPQTFTEAIGILKRDYLAVRRVHLYQTYGPEGKAVIPPAQPGTAVVQFGDIGFALPAGDPDSEYLTLVNRNGYAVDISNWTIGGEVRHAFQPGVVIPAGGTLYVTPDVVAFRHRMIGPTGGEGRFVQGGYRGRVSSGAGVLKLYDADGELIASKAFHDLRPLGESREIPLF